MVYPTTNLFPIMLKISYDFLNLFLAYLSKVTKPLLTHTLPYPGPSTEGYCD